MNRSASPCGAAGAPRGCEDEGYYAYSPNLPGYFSNGRTIEDTKRNITFCDRVARGVAAQPWAGGGGLAMSGVVAMKEKGGLQVGQELRAGWRWVRLGDHVAKIGSGLTPLGGQSSYLKAGIPLIRSQNVHMNRFTSDGLAFISAAQDGAMQESRVRPGDVLLNITGASIGMVCVVPGEL